MREESAERRWELVRATTGFVVLALLLYACGGGGGTSLSTSTGGSTTGTTATSGTSSTGGTATSGGTTGISVQVTVEPANTECFVDGQIQFVAHVFGSQNTAVTWSVDGLNRGTIDANGLYTAPSNKTSATVRATSVVNPTKSGIAGVTIKARATIQFIASESGIEQLPRHHVYDVSESGTIVVGSLAGAKETPAYWSDSTGWVALPFPPGADSAAVKNTADGIWMVGWGKTPGDGTAYAVRWNRFTGAEWLTDLSGNKISIATEIACSATAAVVAFDKPSNTFVHRWRGGLGVDVIGLMELGCVSTNGVVIGGSFNERIATWTDNSGTMSTGISGRMEDFNGFGTLGGGMRLLPQSPGSFFWNGTVTFHNGDYLSMTANGAWVIYATESGADFWSPSGTTVGVLDHLYAMGLTTDLTGWQIDHACYSSNDRKRITGELRNGIGARKTFHAIVP